MPIPVKMPKLGETVVDGTVARWHKQPGDAIEKLEPLLDISTDKIDTEVPSPAAGTLLEILVGEGETVAAGTVLAYIGAAGEKVARAPDTETSDGDEKPRGRAFISPVVARIAAEHGVDLEQVEGSGLHGRITKQDILAFVATGQPAQETDAPAEAAPATTEAAPVAEEILQPLSTMRRIIAEHMVRSARTAPHVTTVHEVDMTAVVRHRDAQQGAFAARGLRLTYSPYFVAAVAEALRAIPEANSHFTSDGLRLNRRIHIGVAVSVPGGLVVPVVRDADERNLAGLARTIDDLANRARQGRLRPDEVRGGTFTITNHGTAGSLLATPILHEPQAGILGVGAIVKRPVVRSTGASLLPSADDAIVIRPMCYLSFSFDHRVLDGAEADAFVGKIKSVLEKWGSGTVPEPA